MLQNFVLDEIPEELLRQGENKPGRDSQAKRGAVSRSRQARRNVNQGQFRRHIRHRRQMRNISHLNKGFAWKRHQGEFKVLKLPKEAGQTPPMTYEQFRKLHPEK